MAYAHYHSGKFSPNDDILPATGSGLLEISTLFCTGANECKWNVFFKSPSKYMLIAYENFSGMFLFGMF
jgi:hypothetical protein